MLKTTFTVQHTLFIKTKIGALMDRTIPYMYWELIQTYVSVSFMKANFSYQTDEKVHVVFVIPHNL